MMTTEAFNGLLKTLEESPEHVIFILTKVNNEDIKARLKIVLQKEGVNYNEEVVDIIILIK